MTQFIVKRLVLFIPTLFVISIVVFILIQLPPGDYLTTLVIQLQDTGELVDEAAIAALEKRYGLNQPIWVQYQKWITNIVVSGDFGQSFEWNQPVSELIWERLGWTLVISTVSLLFIWAVSFPIGVYSATHQYSLGDTIFSFIGFIGLAVPNFLLALILMWVSFTVFKLNMGGLFSPDLEDAPWSVTKFIDLLSHLWVPVLVLGTAGTAGLIRIMRANLLDELNKPYVEAARAKGLGEVYLIWKYPVRVALNPFVSSIGNILPQLISGATIISVVLNLPTTGPLLLRALLSQDMFLAGSFLLILSVLTLLGTLLSDFLLAWLDPRIRYD